MKIKGNKNNVIINSHNVNKSSKRKKRITIISILTIISLLVGIYTDVYDHVINLLTNEKSTPNKDSSLNYDHATFGNNSKERKD